MLPIVRRELHIAARKPATYRQRLFIGGAAVFLALVFFLFGFSTPNEAGAAMFGTLMWAAFVITFLDGIRCASDAIAWERREGTLGLLFLTDLRGFDVVLGKFSSAAVRAMSTTIVTLPVFALPVLVGGVTAGESMRVMLTLVVAVFYSLSAGLLVSAICTSGIAALAGTFISATVLMVAPAVISKTTGFDFSWAAGPLGMLLTANDFTYYAAGGYWPAMLFSVVLSVAFLFGAGHIASRPGSFDPKWGAANRLTRFFQAGGGYTETWGGHSGRWAPAVWLAERTLPGRRALWLIVGAGAIGCFLNSVLAPASSVTTATIIWIIVFSFFTKLWMGAVAPQSLHQARKSGALELLACTPLRSPEIIRGQTSTLFAYVSPIGMTICLGFPFLAAIGSGFVHTSNSNVEFGLMILFGLVGLCIFFLDVAALIYAGLWFGLTSPRAEQAMGKTIGYVLISQWLTALIPCFGVLGFLLWPIFWIAWASSKLNQRFSSTITEQFRTQQ